MKKYAKFFLIPLLIVILLQIVSWSQLFKDTESKITDQLFQLRGNRPISGDIAIVAIDDET
ncbi:MAG TPA: hypothetical protein PLE74_13255, partial [Candidatus Cloacimonadota bacterium]|nr:hypothetical protein [Candidatus Cloacimonadota bacterium]